MANSIVASQLAEQRAKPKNSLPLGNQVDWQIQTYRCGERYGSPGRFSAAQSIVTTALEPVASFRPGVPGATPGPRLSRLVSNTSSAREARYRGFGLEQLYAGARLVYVAAEVA